MDSVLVQKDFHVIPTMVVHIPTSFRKIIQHFVILHLVTSFHSRQHVQ